MTALADKSNKKPSSWKGTAKKAKNNSKPPLLMHDSDYDRPSELSKSMKYVEPWLYGPGQAAYANVSSHGQPVFGTIPTELAVIVCSCTEYLTGTKRDTKKPTICKKCKGSRLPLTQIGGTMRVHHTQPMHIMHSVRGAIGTICINPAAKSRPSIFDLQTNPYDEIRRSRLMSPQFDSAKGLMQASSSTMQSRSKSVSPSRSRSRLRKTSPQQRLQSPPAVAAAATAANTSNKKKMSQAAKVHAAAWTTLDIKPDTTIGRRSILQCDVNPYDLIAKFSHNNEFAPFAEDANYDSDILRHSQKYEDILVQRSDSVGGGRNFTGSRMAESAPAEKKTYEPKVKFSDKSRSLLKQITHPQPIRPPRKKNAVTNSIEVVVGIKEEKNSIRKSSVNSVNGVKSILKRPLSVTSDSESEYGYNNLNNSKSMLPKEITKNIIYECEEKNPKSSYSRQSSTSSTYSQPSNVSPVLVRNVKSSEMLSSSGMELHQKQQQQHQQQQRKKVQFLMENETIASIDVATASATFPTPSSSVSNVHYGAETHKLSNNGDDVVYDNKDDDDDVKSNLNTNIATANGMHDKSPSSWDGNDEKEDCLPNSSTSNIGRSWSYRRSSDSSCVSGAAKNPVEFHDTMALRSKSSKNDSRSIFMDDSALIKHRPREPPPSPPNSGSRSVGMQEKTEASAKLLKSKPMNLNNVTVIDGNETPCTTYNNADDEYSHNKLKLNNSSHDINKYRKNNNTSLEENPLNDIQNHLGQHHQLNKRKTKENDPNNSVYNKISNKTSLKVEPSIIDKSSSGVHRLEIRHNDDDEYEDHKKTSIVISGNGCYSTVNISNDVPIYQSSVVVNDSSHPKANIFQINSNSVTINVNSPSPGSSHQQEMTYKNNQINTLLSSSVASVIPIGTSPKHYNREDSRSSYDGPNTNVIKSNNKRTVITLDYDNVTPAKSDAGKSLVPIDVREAAASPATEEELIKLLRDPVEAVKRNLVPHVCGKSLHKVAKTPRDGSSSNQKQTATVKRTLEQNGFIGKLLEDPILAHLTDGLDSDLVVKLIENSLQRLKDSRCNLDLNGTKDEEDMTKFIEASLQRVQEERQQLDTGKRATAEPAAILQDKQLFDDQDKSSNRDSMSSRNSYSSANYELFDFDNSTDLSDCYQSCSSEMTGEGDGNTTRHKFYQMLVDATLSEIEISANNDDDHAYETVRIGDPIYEEICDRPPPLPLCPPPSNDCSDSEKKNAKSMFEGASKYDILLYLVDAKERGIVPEDSYTFNALSTTPEEEKSVPLVEHKSLQDGAVAHLSKKSAKSMAEKPWIHRKCPADIERNDSGVGSETSKSSRSKYQSAAAESTDKNSSLIHLCEDCDDPVETQRVHSSVQFAPLVCRKCAKKRTERKEILTEIVETEEKYCRDLQIILEEFYQPMLVAGLLSQDQLSAIFLNTEELLENSQSLAERMRDALDIAVEQGDDDLLSVNIGKVLLEAAPMLHAFETYCIRQASASLLLANLEKEKELLRIFLRVSQMENTVLRRMNLNSFLMVPVQRVTKYPLLLARIYKVTPSHIEDRELLKQAQEKIELHLYHINKEAKDIPTKLWRRISPSSPGRQSSSEIDMSNIKLRKMAIDVLEWNHDEVRFVFEGKLLFTQPTDNNWKKSRTIKLTPINALLVTYGKPNPNHSKNNDKSTPAVGDQLNFSRNTGIREATLLLMKEKYGRYTLLREPLYLDRCIVCTDAEWVDYFEVQEIFSKDTFIFKAENGGRTKQWYSHLQYHSQGMGAWRKRRNALANIMMNGMMMRT